MRLGLLNYDLGEHRQGNLVVKKSVMCESALTALLSGVLARSGMFSVLRGYTEVVYLWIAGLITSFAEGA